MNHSFHDPELAKLAAVAESTGATMRTATRTRRGAPSPNGQAPQPGAAFRIPGVGARPRRVLEVGPCAQATTINLKQASMTPAPFLKFQTLDIDRAFLLELDWNVTYTTGTGAALTASPMAPYSFVHDIQVQFESAYSTFRLPAWLAAIFQSFRSFIAPNSDSTSYTPENGVNTIPANGPNANGAGGWFPSTSPLATPNLAITTAGVANTFSTFLEIPVSMYFDLYYELSATGQPIGMPIPRAIVSPQRMAATTRNVTPKVNFAALLTATDLFDSPLSTSSVTVQTATGSVNATWWRDAWIPTDNQLTEPPGRMWQYTRDYIAYQPAGATIPIVPLDDEVPGQGQILSLVFCTWDPALNSGLGGFTPWTSYLFVELLLGSNVQLYQDTPQSNLYAWTAQHGAILPNGHMGWDLMLTEDGRLTNENAINTLVQNGAQLRITYAAGSKPGNSATIYVGLEVLKKVGS